MGNLIYIFLLFHIGVSGIAASAALYLMANFMSDHTNIKDWEDTAGKVIPPLTVVKATTFLAPMQHTWFNAGWGFVATLIPVALSAWVIFKRLKRREPMYPGKFLFLQVVLAWIFTLFGSIYVALGFSSALATFNGTALPTSPGAFNSPKAAFIFTVLFAVSSVLYALWSSLSYWSMRRRMMHGDKYQQEMGQEEYTEEPQQQQHHRR